MSLYLIAALPVLSWLYLMLLRGAFWLAPYRNRATFRGARDAAARVVAVIPARDEAPVIAVAVTSLLRQDFAGTLHLVLVDDGSTDGTAEAARVAARAAGGDGRLTVVAGSALAPGWTGKLWALAQGVEVAATLAADYLLLTDADIEHAPHSVAALTAYARTHDCDLVSHMVRLSTASFAERFLIPAFVFFFFKLYPPAWVASPRHKSAAAAGGCVLLTPRALQRAGGLQTIRSHIIDDCALAAAVKRTGGRIALQLAPATRSLRVYRSAGEISAMIARTAFAQLGHSYLAVVGTVLGMFLAYLLPVLLLLRSEVVLASCGCAALLLMSLCFLPMVRFYRLSPLWCICLPAVALFYLGAVLRSALEHARGSGGRWKGRVQDA
jgi:hopene-associated glycosyltransferase HpnB